MKRTIIASAAASLALAGGVLGAAPANAAPVVTGGLVNVTVTDVLSNNTTVVNDVLSRNNVGVGAALHIAANVCGVGVNVLAAQLGNSTPTCTNTAGDQVATITQATRG